MEIAAAIAPVVLKPAIGILLNKFVKELKSIATHEGDVRFLFEKLPLLKRLVTQMLDRHYRSRSFSDTLPELLKQGFERWLDDIEDAEILLAKFSPDTRASVSAFCIPSPCNIRCLKQIRKKINEMQAEIPLYLGVYLVHQFQSRSAVSPSTRSEIMESCPTPQLTRLQTTACSVTIERRLNGQLLRGDIDTYATDFVVVAGRRNPLISGIVNGEGARATGSGEPCSIVLRAHNMDNGQHMSIHSCQDELLVTTNVRRILEIDALSVEERWELFRFHVFNNTFYQELGDNETEEILQAIFQSIASMPYLVEAVAHILARVNSVLYWQLKLAQFTLPSGHLYDRYRDLPNFVKPCFLSCAVFPKDEEINVENVVELWIAEGLLPIKHPRIDLVSFGYEVVKLLLRYRLIEARDYDWERRPVHCIMPDRVHYMAVQILNQGEICYLKPRENLNSFTWPENRFCSTISLIGNNIQHLPRSSGTTSVRSLLLRDNTALNHVPGRFLEGLIWLRVLDLSNTSILSLPASLGMVKRLVHLNLSSTKITGLPKSIRSLTRLQFLILSSCQRLEFLPKGICRLQRLKHLDVGGCTSLRSLPHGVHTLEGLQVLKTNATQVWNCLPRMSQMFSKGHRRMACLGDLKALTKLKRLYLDSEDESVIPDGVLGNKTNMQSLWLRMTKLDALPEDMTAMADFTQLQLWKCMKLQELPIWVSEFCNLRFLCLNGCYSLRSLPCLERMPLLRALVIELCESLMELPLQFGRDGAFPALESLALVGLKIRSLPRLERGAMSKLQHLALKSCNNLTRLSDGIEYLENLRTLELVDSHWLVCTISYYSDLLPSSIHIIT